MPRPTNFERVMGVVNSTKGKRVATADIAKALKVPIAKVRMWLLDWDSKGWLCVNKQGVVSRKRGPSMAKHYRDNGVDIRQLSLPFDVHGDPDCPPGKIYVFDKEPEVRPLPLVLQSLAFRDEALQRAYPDEATALTGDNPLLNIFKKEDENA